MIVDTSVILAIFFKEKHFDWATEQLNLHANDLLMSTVNLAEVLILINDKQPKLSKFLEEQIFNSGIKFIPPDIQQAQIAALARLKFPLNLGDCFVYALAVQEDSPILTIDRDFKKVDRLVLLPD